MICDSRSLPDEYFYGLAEFYIAETVRIMSDKRLAEYDFSDLPEIFRPRYQKARLEEIERRNAL